MITSGTRVYLNRISILERKSIKCIHLVIHEPKLITSTAETRIGI